MMVLCFVCFLASFRLLAAFSVVYVNGACLHLNCHHTSGAMKHETEEHKWYSLVLILLLFKTAGIIFSSHALIVYIWAHLKVWEKELSQAIFTLSEGSSSGF